MVKDGYPLSSHDECADKNNKEGSCKAYNSLCRRIMGRGLSGLNQNINQKIGKIHLLKEFSS